jgi:hypothetical protein
MKPADFYVGIIDLFAIMLPGAGIAWAVWRLPGVSAVLEPFLPPSPEGKWIAFALATLASGQLLWAFASRLDDRWDEKRGSDPSIAADPARQVARALREAMLGVPTDIHDEERRLWAETVLDRAAVPRRAYGFLNDTLSRERHILSNSYEFTQAVLRVWCPSAVIEVERTQAASKFFRSFYYVLPVFALSLSAGAVWRLVSSPGAQSVSATLFAAAAALALVMLMPACRRRFFVLRDTANDQLYRALAVSLAV